MLTATVQLQDRDDRRDVDRIAVNRMTTARDAGARPCDVVVHNFSREGIGFASDATFAIGVEITIGLAGGGVVGGRIVRKDRKMYGCAFDRPLTHRQIEDAFGVSPLRPLFDAATDLDFTGATCTALQWPGAVRGVILIGGAALGWSLVGLVAYFA